MNEEERMDEIIRSAAGEYNSPPATPKDDMWNAIVAAREVPRLHVTAGGAPRSTSQQGYNAPKRFSTRFAWIGLAAAAVLLVATGVGIGRWTSQSTTTPQRIANNPPPVPVAPTDEVTAPAAPETFGGEEAGIETAAKPQARVEQQPRQRSREEILRDPRVVGTRTLNTLAGTRSPSSSNQFTTPVVATMPGSNSSYQVATQRHLADAEALLTSFSLGNRNARMDAQFASWAKGLLSNTRLLLDSPAGDDPRRAKLLQDLELVLAQIVQLSPNAAAQDRELIEGSINEGHVMTRLRTAIPADASSTIPEKQ